MKIIVAGDGKVGTTLIEQLSTEGYDLTLVDIRGDVLELSADEYDVIGVQGNCASMSVLKQAGVEEADLLIAATGKDEINLLSCLTAHGLNSDIHTIARICNPEYAEQIYKMRDIFALSMSINPEKQAALEIERLLKYPGFLKRDTFAKGRVEIVELKVDANSKLCNVALTDMYSIVKAKCLVCAVLRNGVATIPDGNFVLKDGDRIFVTAAVNNLTELLKNLGIITHKVRRVIICGGSKVSYYLAERLQNSGITVQLIENNREKCEELAKLLPDTCIIHGDACDEALLQNEGIAECDALVTMTGFDELNIVISMYGSRCNVPQIITKLSRLGKSNILEDLSLGSIICPKELCSNMIVRYVRAINQTGGALTIHSIADGHAEALEFRVDSRTLHCGEAIKNLKIKKDVRIACINHEGNTEITSGESIYQRGDTVILVTSGNSVIYTLNDIFE